MITRNDCILLLTDLKNRGIDVDTYLQKTIRSLDVDIDVLNFINKNRQLDLARFYEKIRHSYNKKRSNLYINIMKEVSEPQEILTTLSSLLLQALLYAKDANDRDMFIKHARCEEISKVLTKYFIDYDLTSCFKLLNLVKCDIKALESIR